MPYHAHAHRDGFQMLNTIKFCFTAAAMDSIEAVKKLIAEWSLICDHPGPVCDAVSEIRDGNGKTLLHVAVQAGNVPVVQWLLETNKMLSDTKTLDKPFGHSPHRYVTYITDRKARRMVLSMLLEANPGGVWCGLVHIAAREGYIDVLRQIVSFYRDEGRPILDLLNEDTEELGRPLQCAIGQHTRKVIKFLLQHLPVSHLIIGSPKSGLPPPLVIAAVQESDSFELLLKQPGLSDDNIVQCVDAQGSTIAHFVAESNSTKHFKLLKEIFPFAYKNMIHQRVLSPMTTNIDIQAILKNDIDTSNITDSKAGVVIDDNEDYVGTNSRLHTDESDEEKQIRADLRRAYDGEQDSAVDNDVLNRLNNLKQEGFVAVAARQWSSAILIYEEALAICPKVPSTQVYRSKVHANISLCHFYVERDSEATKESARHAVALQPTWWKAYLRLAMALAAEGNYTEACNQVYQGMLKLRDDEQEERKIAKGFLDAFLIEVEGQVHLITK